MIREYWRKRGLGVGFGMVLMKRGGFGGPEDLASPSRVVGYMGILIVTFLSFFLEVWCRCILMSAVFVISYHSIPGGWDE